MVHLTSQISIQCLAALLMGTWGILGMQGNFLPIRTTEVLGKQYVRPSAHPTFVRDEPTLIGDLSRLQRHAGPWTTSSPAPTLCSSTRADDIEEDCQASIMWALPSFHVPGGGRM